MPQRGVIEWLLACDEPAVRYGTLVDLLGESPTSPRARREAAAALRSGRVYMLLEDQQDDGGFGVHAYQKWAGAHWRLIRLADLGCPTTDPRVKRAIDSALPWVLSHQPLMIQGRPRRCASQQGAAIWYCVRLGLADDPRVRTLVERLMAWQWEDGGWNCDKRPEADHSSFHESWVPLLGLAEYRRVTGDSSVEAAVDAASELLLCHHLFRRDHDPAGGLIHRDFVKLHYPSYWHYDVLAGLRALRSAGKLGDPRATEALALVESKRREDGTWAADGRYWKRPGRRRAGVDVVPWTATGKPCPFVTLEAMKVLGAAAV
jgi:hypothetical protein